MNRSIRGTLCAVIGGICWGFSGCCGQYLLSIKNMDSNLLTTIRLLASGIILLIISFFTQRKNLTEALKDKKDLARILCFGIFGMMLCQLSYLTAIKYTNAATATVIQYVGPVLVTIVVCVMRRKLPTPAEVTAVIFAVTGTFLIATHADPSSLVISTKGLVWSILAAVSVVTYTLIPGKVIEKRSSAVVSGYGMTVGGVILFFALRVWKTHISLDTGSVLATAAIVLIGTVAAFSLYLQAVSDVGPMKASVIASIEPVSSAVISWLWLGNTFMPVDIIGFALIISTVFLLSAKKGKINLKKYF